MVQKILIYRDRERGDRAKDLLYIHDTLETVAGNLPAIANDWQTYVKPLLSLRAPGRILGTLPVWLDANVYLSRVELSPDLRHIPDFGVRIPGHLRRAKSNRLPMERIVIEVPETNAPQERSCAAYAICEV